MSAADRVIWEIGDKDPGQRLQDILDNIEAVRAFTAGMDFAAYTADRKTTYAVTRTLEIIRRRAVGCRMS